MEKEPKRRHPEVPEGTPPAQSSLEKEFYAREIQDTERKISDRKEEFLELEATVKMLGQEMAQGRLDDETAVHEALNKLAVRLRNQELTGAIIDARKTLEAYEKESPFKTLGGIKADITERKKKIMKELRELSEDAMRMEGTRDDE